MSCCRVILVVVSAITPPWLASVVTRGGMRGHRERFDALVTPIATQFATHMLDSMLVALWKPI